MFGYIIPDKPYLLMKDYGLYRAIYCGICVTTGEEFGQFARFTTNYDMVFLSSLFHNFTGDDIDASMRKCALHRIKKRLIAKTDELTKLLCYANIILVFYNLTDDVLDEGGTKKTIARNRLKNAYKKARKAHPELDKMIKKSYDDLRALENSECTILDAMCEPFSIMMQNVTKYVLGEKANQDILDLTYNFGKWVYLIDGVDDLEKDFEKKQFNPFIKSLGEFTSRKEFMEKHNKDIEFSIYAAIDNIKRSYSNLEFKFNKDLTDNIVYRGIVERTKGVLSGESVGKTPKI